MPAEVTHIHNVLLHALAIIEGITTSGPEEQAWKLALPLVCQQIRFTLASHCSKLAFQVMLCYTMPYDHLTIAFQAPSMLSLICILLNRQAHFMHLQHNVHTISCTCHVHISGYTHTHPPVSQASFPVGWHLNILLYVATPISPQSSPMQGVHMCMWCNVQPHVTSPAICRIVR